MIRRCRVCGNEYSLRTAWFDKGYCPLHKPSFFSAPVVVRRSLDETPEGTKYVWYFDVAIHAFYLFLSFVILDMGEFSVPLRTYALTVLVYFSIRFAIAANRGYPILTGLQRICLSLLPLWGPVEALVFFYWGQHIRYGHWAVRDVIW